MSEGVAPREALAARGWALIPAGMDLREAALSPWSFAERLFGERPVMLERQPIRATPEGRSFASTRGYTPLHSDSQLHLGAPPDAQVMACVRPAARGGETLLLDTWDLLDALARADPALLRALFEAPRRIPFVFGDVYGPTVALRGGALAFTHSPMELPRDPLAQRLAAHLRARPVTTLRVAEGEVLVVDNRRMLHGRNAFDDTTREFTRLLVWLRAPLGAHPGHTARASAAVAVPGDADALVRARFGEGEAPDARAQARLRVVLSMLQGVAPGALAQRGGVPEAVLYQWRDVALRAALRALAEASDEDASARCEQALARGQGASGPSPDAPGRR